MFPADVALVSPVVPLVPLACVPPAAEVPALSVLDATLGSLVLAELVPLVPGPAVSAVAVPPLVAFVVPVAESLALLDAVGSPLVSVSPAQAASVRPPTTSSKWAP